MADLPSRDASARLAKPPRLAIVVAVRTAFLEEQDEEEDRLAKYVKILSKSYCTTNYGWYIHRSVWPERDTGQHNPQSRELTTLRVQE